MLLYKKKSVQYVMIVYFFRMNQNLWESDTPKILKLADDFISLLLRELTKKSIPPLISWIAEQSLNFLRWPKKQ